MTKIIVSLLGTSLWVVGYLNKAALLMFVRYGILIIPSRYIPIYISLGSVFLKLFE